MEYVIQTQHLTKLYNGTNGCRDISLNVPEGVVFGFLGPNGAGKSTFVRTMLGLIHPTSGSGTILGEPIQSNSARAKIGYLPELFRYPEWMTGKQLLEAHADLCHVPHRDQKTRIEFLLDLVGLGKRGYEKIKGYSKGMQQRIGLACSLISDPDVLFLDEPTSALDPIGRKEVRMLISELVSQGKTIFLNSHLLSEVESICNQVAIIHKGSMVTQGNWRELSSVRPQAEITLSKFPTSWSNELPEWIQDYTEIRQVPEGTSYLVTLIDNKHIPLLVRSLSNLHIDIYEVTPKQPHLEEIFMYWINQKEGTNKCGPSPS